MKLIGATSHYVTDVLDEGPIIEQEPPPAYEPRAKTTRTPEKHRPASPSIPAPMSPARKPRAPSKNAASS